MDWSSCGASSPLSTSMNWPLASTALNDSGCIGYGLREANSREKATSRGRELSRDPVRPHSHSHSMTPSEQPKLEAEALQPAWSSLGLLWHPKLAQCSAQPRYVSFVAGVLTDRNSSLRSALQKQRGPNASTRKLKVHSLQKQRFCAGCLPGDQPRSRLRG